MKTNDGFCLFALLVVALRAWGAEPQIGDKFSVVPDIRIVNGFQVDLWPVHQWLRDQQGERPMKHWKQLQIYNLKGIVAGFTHCVVKIEDKDFAEIYVKNLPARIVAYFQKLRLAEAVIEDLRARIAVEEPIARRQNAVALTGASGSAEYVDQTMAERAHANLAMVAVNEKKEALAKLVAARDVLRNNGIDITKILAMPLGTKYTNLSVWDCGISK